MAIDVAQAPKGEQLAGTSLTLTTAAEFVAAVYTRGTTAKKAWFPTAKNAWTPRDWINPDEQTNSGRYYLDSVLADVTQADSHLYKLDVGEKRKYYQQALDVVLPAIERQARAWALEVLSKQDLKLGTLRIVVDSPLKEQLHSAARNARKHAREDVLPVTTRAEYAEITGQSRSRPKGTVVTRLERVRYMHAVRDVGNKYLFSLMAHPRGVKLVNEFAESADGGRDYSDETIDECRKAIIDTRTDLQDDSELVWRFPPALALGARSLGLGPSPALTKFALAWASTKKTGVESALEIAGNAIFVLDFVGPLGAAASEILTVVLAAIGTAVSFLRDLEQDQAATATAFADETEKLSEGSRGLGTVLLGAATILAALPAAAGALRRVTGSGGKLAAEAAEVAEYLPPVREPPNPRGLPVQRVEREAIADAERAVVSPKTTKVPGPTTMPEPLPLAPEARAAVSAETRGTSSEAGSVTAKAVSEEQKAIPTEARAVAPETSSVEPTLKRQGPESKSTKARRTKEPAAEPVPSPDETDPRSLYGAREAGPAPPVRPTALEPKPDSVPAAELRKEQRRAIERQIEELEAERAKFYAEVKNLRAQFDDLSKRAAEAERAGRRPEAAVLRSEREILREEIFTGREVGRIAEQTAKEIAELRRVLASTQADYFEALTRAASGRDAYKMIKRRAVDEVFGSTGPLEVEHIYPRSKIFGDPKFAELNWKEQIAIFNYEPNLRLMSKDANLLRSNKPYASLPQSFWSRFVPDRGLIPRLSAELAKKEAEMQAEITRLIRDGAYRRTKLDFYR